MKFKVMEVGDMGTHVLPLPKKLLEQLKWKSGDILKVEIPMVYQDQLILFKDKTNA